ncbi:MAG: GNAT family N-acetyltransferase [Betaproteobacteria bacterium]|nr:GNAT family N-acetyltransferase [Betaproteobacteria bacterium]
MVPVVSAGQQLESVRELFLEYAQSLGFSLCFQGFNEELASLPGDYVSPDGCLLLAMVDGTAAGCVAVRKLDVGRCEMKRLYVRPHFRAAGLGRKLAQHAIAHARRSGCHAMVLDTVPESMAAACKLYQSLGFRDCAPYYDNSPIGSQCMQKRLWVVKREK